MKLTLQSRPPSTDESIHTDPVTGGQKGVKQARYELIPFDALEEVARVYGFGAEKYEADNWLRGYRWRYSAGALLRHVAAFMRGEERDPESQLLHLAHAAWHCLTLMTFAMRGLGTDDRKPPLVPRPILPPLVSRAAEIRAEARARLGTRPSDEEPA